MWMLLSLLVLVLLAYQTLKDLYLIYIRRIPPGPLSLPLIGGLYRFSPSQPHLSTVKLVEKYGKIFSLQLGPAGRAVFLQDINLINQVFESPVMNDRPDMKMFDIVDQGAQGIGSCPYGNKWKEQTRTLNRGLTRLSSTSVAEKANHAYGQVFKRFAIANKAYSPRTDVVKACSAIFSSIVYGVDSESLDNDDLKSRMQYHKTIMSHLHPAHPVNLFPDLWKLPLPMKETILSCLKERDELLQSSLRRRMASFSGTIENAIDIVAGFLLNTTDSGLSDKNDMLVSLWALYLAGCETLVDTTLWLMLHLCLFSDVQKKIQAEIEEISTDTANVLEETGKLNYTRATILESLRLSSPVAVGLPHTSKQDVELGGYTIPAGTMIMANQWYIHHDENLWPDPFTLKPERFIDDNGDLFPSSHIFKKMPYIPFSRGKRPCIGQHVAQDLLLIFTTGLLKKFSLKLPDGFEPDMGGKVNFNLEPPEFSVILTER